MAGPVSSGSSCRITPQLVETMPYRVKPRRGKTPHRFGVHETLLDVDAMYAFAREHREKNKNKWMEADRLGGFCLLLKRQVLDRVSLPKLEKWTDLSLFDTDILSVKARQAGFTLACCRDLFIHHFGTRTFSHGSQSNAAKPKEVRIT
jgi:GT2 family glycosyltransferase